MQIVNWSKTKDCVLLTNRSFLLISDVSVG